MERIPAGEFVPPHCPWRECPSNTDPAGHPFRFRREGFYRRKSPPHRVQKFSCRVCGRGFSQQTFSATYYLKHPERMSQCAAAMVAGESFSQMADVRGGHRSSWARLSERLARHCLLLHEDLRREAARRSLLREEVVYDDFETFAGCQDYPLAIGTAVGSRSHYVLALAAAPHRRPRSREWERRRRDRRYRRYGPPPRGRVRAAAAAVRDRLLPLLPPGASLVLSTDAHPAYRVFDHHPRIRHRTWPNPRRRKGSRRTPAMARRDHAMFAGDFLHLLLRHASAGHRRETIAFHRRHDLAAGRIFVFATWRNLVRPLSRRRGRPGRNVTPATTLGLADRPWSWTDVLARRLFPWKTPLPDDLRRLYYKELDTPTARPNTRHRRVHAD